MPYTAPAFEALLENITKKSLFPNETESRLLLAEQLATITQFVIKMPNNTANELPSQLIGANIYFLEMISQEYYVHSPEFKEGYIYNSGSPLYSFIAKGLNVTAENPLTPEDKLIFLNDFYQFTTENADQLEILPTLQTNIKNMLTNLIYALTAHIANIVNAVPTEKAITVHMDQLPEEYQQQKVAQSNSWFSYFIKPNENRILFTQLAKLISKIECEDETHLPPNVLARSQRIKMGLLKFIAITIENEYWIRSAYNSKLYSECKKVLNAYSVENLDASQTIACFAAFRSFINSYEERQKLERAARQHFKKDNVLENIDDILDSMSRQLEVMIKKLTAATHSNWPATQAMANIGMIVGSVPGYALGNVLSYALSQSEIPRQAKTVVGTTAANIATAVFQSTSAGYFSFVMGDFLIKSILSRALAKLLETIGKTVGGAIGGAIGYVFFDLTYECFLAIGSRFLNYCDAHPKQIRDADRRFVKCLLTLPRDLFSQDKQMQIRYAEGVEHSQQYLTPGNEETSCRKTSF